MTQNFFDVGPYGDFGQEYMAVIQNDEFSIYCSIIVHDEIIADLTLKTLIEVDKPKEKKKNLKELFEKTLTARTAQLGNPEDESQPINGWKFKDTEYTLFLLTNDAGKLQMIENIALNSFTYGH